MAECRDLYQAISANLVDVRARLARATQRVNRDPSAIRLVAVSKTHPIDAVRAACLAGQIEFGENRVQEALQKIRLSSDTAIKWHLVGHLQSNKARKAAAVFDCIHSIDSVDLLGHVDAGALEAGHQPDVLVQVDLAGEPTKHGATLEALVPLFEAAAACRAARVIGLMVLPPFAENPEETRPFFARLRDIRDELERRGVPASMLQDLSMGMSHDFEVAIEEGATLVRVGTAIFGDRG